MRKLLIILMFGSLFADTIECRKKTLGFWEDYTIKGVDVMRIEDEKVWYKTNSLFGKRINSIPCKNVFSITNSFGNTIDFDCSTNSLNVSQELDEVLLDEVLLDNSSRLQPKISGIFFAIGGAILLTNADPECDNCSTPEKVDDFYDSVKSTQKLGYVFIIIGGILLTIGI